MLLQGYPSREYILVDGGSTDDSINIIRKYENYISWWVSDGDRGQSHAINKGFRRATGDVHAYLNSDDVYEPGALFACAEAFRKGHEWLAGDVRCFQKFKNWSPTMAPDQNTTWLGMEYFCTEGDGLWAMSDGELLRVAAHEVAQIGLT